MGKVTGAKRRLPLFVALRMLKAAHEALRAEREMAPPPPPPPPKADNLLDEIDAIFDDIKATKRKKAQLPEQKAAKPKQRRHTGDGLPIFTEEELKMDNPKAGTTPLCPFDCDCCH
jgi:hypothetical protein